MNEEIDLETLQDVMKISYPTALKFAKTHGRLNQEPPKGKWYVPASLVRDMLLGELVDVDERLRVLATAVNGES